MLITYTIRFFRKKYRQRQTADGDHTSESKDSATTTTSTSTPVATTANRSKTGPVCPDCAQEKATGRKYRWKILFCLLPAFIDSSLDLTVVATALPRIASHFNRFNQLNWIVTAFTLTSTAFIPVYGQLADTFGRFPTIEFSVIVVAIGGVLCASAPAWWVLLLGRALQGVGSAGVTNLTLIILADRVSLKEQAVNTSIFQMMGGVGYSIGPVIGGYLTNSNWRYCFALSCCMSAVSLTALFFLRKELLPGRVSFEHCSSLGSYLSVLKSGLSTLDFGGILLFIFGVGLLILGTAWGGSTYSWSSAAVLVSLILGVVTLATFVWWEISLTPGRLLSRRLPNTTPMIPARILSAKDVTLICVLSAGTGAALFSVFYFIGIYFTLVEGYKASEAGTQLLYYVPGLGVGVVGATLLCNRWPRQTFWPLSIGTIVETIGIAVICYAVKSRNETLVNVMMVIAGIGTGVRFMPSNLHLAGMFRDRLASVYSLLRFSMPFGGTLALTIMGAVFQNKMSDYFGSDSAIAGSVNLHDQSSLDSISKLPIEQQNAVRAQGADATMWAFISILPILILTVITSSGLGNVWISKRVSKAALDAERPAQPEREDGKCPRHAGEGFREDETTANEVDVVEESYLLALFRGDVQKLKKKGPHEHKRGNSSESKITMSEQPLQRPTSSPVLDDEAHLRSKDAN